MFPIRVLFLNAFHDLIIYFRYVTEPFNSGIIILKGQTGCSPDISTEVCEGDFNRAVVEKDKIEEKVALLRHFLFQRKSFI